MDPIALLIILAVAGLGLRLMAGAMDVNRIESYLSKRGSKLRSKSWAPFGTGWVGEKSDRIYKVEYETDAGEIRRATVKTSLLTGVYLTNDRLVQHPGPSATGPAPADDAAALRAENARLKAELDRLSGRRR